MGPEAAQTRGHQNKRGLLFQSYHRLTKKRRNREINIRLREVTLRFSSNTRVLQPFKYNFKHKHLWIKKATGLGYKFVQSNKDKLTMSSKEDNNSKESKEPDYDKDKEQLEEKQEEETGEIDQRETTNRVF